MKYPRSPKDQVGGLVYFGRLVDKIRLMKTGDLHPDLHANLGKGFDERCVDFLEVRYADIEARVAEGLGDQEILAWCLEHGANPNSERIEIWNAFLLKRGWNDDVTEILLRRKRESGLEARADIETMFQYIDADEGR